MFGSKKNKNVSDQSKAVFAQVLEKKEVFEANISQIEEGNKRVAEDLSQLEENTSNLVENATLNVQTETALLHTLEDFTKEQEQVFKDYEQLREGIREQMDAGMELVDQNKHFTRPAKYLSEVSSTLRERNKQYEIFLAEMEECGKNMTALSMNMAANAEQFGDEAKPFVSAAEQIRSNVTHYEKTLAAMMEEIRNSYLELQEMENNIHHMVSLLKDSNKGATNLLKICQKNSTLIEKSVIRDTSEDMAEFRDKVVSLRNLDEEIVKCTERNKLQISDVKEEFLAFKKDLAEVDSDISYFMDLANEQM